MGKVLFVASVVKLHINVFHLPYLQWFQNNNYETHVAAKNDFNNEKYNTPNCDVYYNVSFERSPFSFKNFIAYKQLKQIIDNNNYNIIHCHTPVASILTRLAARKKGTKVIYTAHGFHFFKGAPLINWLLYYPIERLCARFTDVLITINKEDYKLAQSKMQVKKIYYVPGVGIDTDRFANVTVDREKKREELNIPSEAIMLLSVGEVNKNKNHEVIIHALERLNSPNIHYCIAGKGPLENYLIQLASSLGIGEKVHLLGYRDDIGELCKAADIFCFPSHREGLGIAALEAMATGLPLVTSNVHGVNDYTQNGVSGFSCNPNSVDGFAEVIEKLAKDKNLREIMGQYNAEHVKKFDIKIVQSKMYSIYRNVLNT